MEADEVKQEIIRLYYEEHKRPSEIAPIIKKTPQYVSKIVTKDKRYKNEKKYKKKQSLEKKKAYLKINTQNLLSIKNQQVLLLILMNLLYGT